LNPIRESAQLAFGARSLALYSYTQLETHTQLTAPMVNRNGLGLHKDTRSRLGKGFPVGSNHPLTLSETHLYFVRASQRLIGMRRSGEEKVLGADPFTYLCVGSCRIGLDLDCKKWELSVETATHRMI
jgi:hypothetical protein